MKRLNHSEDPNHELFTGSINTHALGAILERWAAYTDLSVVIADAGGFIVWVNPAFTRMCGYNSDELLGRRPGHILRGPLTELPGRKILNEAIRDRRSVQTRLVNYAKGGKPYWVEIHLEPITDSKNHLIGYLSIEREVTREEKHRHEVGELSAAMYAQLVKRLPAGKKGTSKRTGRSRGSTAR